MPVIFGITSCGEALPFIGVGDEADEFVALLFYNNSKKKSCSLG